MISRLWKRSTGTRSSGETLQLWGEDKEAGKKGRQGQDVLGCSNFTKEEGEIGILNDLDV